MYMLESGFNEEQILNLQRCLIYGVTTDNVAVVLTKFGAVTDANREDALRNVYQTLMKGIF